MPPIAWITALAVTVLLVWMAHRSNTKHQTRGRGTNALSSTSELESEIYRLRHVVVELAIDKHVLLNADTEEWQPSDRRVTRYANSPRRQLR